LWALARGFLAKLVFYRLRGAGGEHTAHGSDNFGEESTHWMLKVDSEFEVDGSIPARAILSPLTEMGKAYTLGLGCLKECTANCWILIVFIAKAHRAVGGRDL
jgi:hypothetical protein